MQNTSMIPAVRWVRKGFACENPKRVTDLASNESDSEMRDDQEIHEDGGIETGHLPNFVSETDPDHKGFSDNYPAAVEDSDEEDQENIIRATDCVLMAAKIEDEASSLEIHIYEEEKFNIYVHHEVLLNSFPVALEWLCCDFSKTEGGSYLRANFALVGLMNSVIELWDLDVLEVVQPLAVVGGQKGHSDSVTSLSLHPTRSNVLASASADRSVRLWDLQTNQEAFRFSDFTQVPQNAIWDIANEALLHAFSADNVLRIIDARTPKTANRLKLAFGVENIAISPRQPELLFISCEDGTVRAVDTRNLSLRNDLMVKAHSQAVTSLVCNQLGHIVSNSLDGTATLLSADNLEVLARQETDCGRLFGGSMHPDSQNLFACGSEIGEVVIWDFTSSLNKTQ